MTDASTRTTTGSARTGGSDERLTAIESILVLVPLLVAEGLLVFALFLPFITTEVDGDEESANLLTLPFRLFGGSGSDTLLGLAFLVLLVAVIGAILTLPLLAKRDAGGGLALTCTAITVLLMLGTIGAWVVIGVGASSDTPWVVAPGLPLLTIGTFVTALLVLLPPYRSIWRR